MLQSVVQPLVRRVTDRGGQTLIQRAIASLRARGTDAHLWLPGVGTLSGLTTGNYLESTGNSVATVDNPTGLVLDALGTVSATELVSNAGGPFVSTAGYSEATATLSVSGGRLIVTNISGVGQGNTGYLSVVVGKTYRISATICAGAANSVAQSTRLVLSENSVATTLAIVDSNGADKVVQYVYKCASATEVYISLQVASGGAAGAVGDTAQAASISVREVSGIHLTQSTTANKGLLKQDAGSRYYWLFDATDLLTGTFPAGYESVTVIDAKSTGQVTTSAANVVGSYSIGPSDTSYGRMIVKGSITASELALYQGFANRLAGL